LLHLLLKNKATPSLSYWQNCEKKIPWICKVFRFTSPRNFHHPHNHYGPFFQPQISACTRTLCALHLNPFWSYSQWWLRHKITVQHCNFKITYILMKALN